MGRRGTGRCSRRLVSDSEGADFILLASLLLCRWENPDEKVTLHFHPPANCRALYPGPSNDSRRGDASDPREKISGSWCCCAGVPRWAVCRGRLVDMARPQLPSAVTLSHSQPTPYRPIEFISGKILEIGSSTLKKE